MPTVPHFNNRSRNVARKMKTTVRVIMMKKNFGMQSKGMVAAISRN